MINILSPEDLVSHSKLFSRLDWEKVAKDTADGGSIDPTSRENKMVPFKCGNDWFCCELFIKKYKVRRVRMEKKLLEEADYQAITTNQTKMYSLPH